MYGEPWPALREHGLTGWVTCRWVPFQVEGTVGGCYWYFRARNGGWSIGLSAISDEDAVDAGYLDAIPGVRCRVEGDDVDHYLSHSWSPEVDGEFAAFVAQAIRDVVAEHLAARR